MGSALAALDNSVNGGAGIKYFHANSTLADSTATGTDSVAVGPLAVATGASSVALGNGAVANNKNDVALGAGSTTAAVSNVGPFDLTGGTAAATAPASVVSVGAAGAERRITNVAAGNLTATSTDAVNGSQLFSVATGANALGTTVASTLGDGAKYTPGTGITGFASSVAGGSQTTVGGALTALDNAAQKANTGLASALGGGAAVAANGTVTAPSYVVGANTYTNVNAALDALQSRAPVQYTAAAGSTTPAGLTPTQSMTLVGKAAGPVTLSNVAAGTLSATSTDAVNGTQLNTTNTAVAALANGTSGLVQQIGGSPGSGNLTVGAGTGGTTVDFTGTGGTRVLAGVSAGSTVTGSTQAINGGQLNTGLASVATNLGGGSTYDPVTGKVTAPSYTIGGVAKTDVGSALTALDNSVNGGAGIKYFHANSTLADSTATGTDSVAVGPLATANAANSVAIGSGSDASRGAITAVLDPLSLTSGKVTTTVGEFSVGSATAPRQITHVAAGTQVTDAVNVGQILPIIAAQNQLGTATAANFGGGATFDPTTGKMTAPSYSVGGTTYTNTGTAIAALDKSQSAGIATNNTAGLGNPVASGTDATAISPGAVASGVDAIAAGKNSLASGAQATAMGPGAKATGAQSVAVGTGALASATSTTALGDNAQATKADATALGQNSVASGLGSTATGFSAQATGDKSLASGSGAVASATGSVALGNGASSSGTNSVALGAGSTDGGQANVVSVGAVGAERKIVNVAAGTVASGSTDAVNGGQLYNLANSAAAALGGGSVVNPDGSISTPTYTVAGNQVTGVGGAVAALDSSVTALQGKVGGVIATNNTSGLANPVASGADATAVSPGALASGADSFAAGKNALASGDQAIALGSGSKATGVSSTALGDLAAATAADATALGQKSVASAANATASGYGAQATGTAATASGNNAIASGVSSSAMGDGSKASGDLATAVGVGALASGKQAIALGSNAQATAFSTTALGDGAVASAANATALGQNSTASGLNATATGFGAKSTGANSVALGSNSTDGGQANVVSIGSVGSERKLVNVAAGTVSSTSTDGVNGSQLNATNMQVAALDHKGLQYNTNGAGKTLSEISLSSDAGGPVVIHNLAAGTLAGDAANVGQLNAVAATASNAVAYDKTPTGGKADTITLQGGTAGAPVGLRNVAAGVNATDAVNLAQLQSSAAGTLASANGYTDQKVSNLAALTAQGLKEAKQLAISGTAVALAGTGLRYDDRPGRTSVSGATSFYKGEVGLAFGLGHTSEDQVWRTNLSVNGTPWADKPEIGVVVGATFTFN